MPVNVDMEKEFMKNMSGQVFSTVVMQVGIIGNCGHPQSCGGEGT